jgi:chromosome segregation ATPase
MWRHPLPYLLAFVVLFTIACSTSSKPHGSYDSPLTGTAASDRQVIRTGSQKVEVKKLEEANASLQKITTDVGGFIESSNFDGDNTSTFRMRVPSKQLDGVMDQIAGLGTELDRNVKAVDVTGELTDLKARLDNAVSLRARLRELAKQAREMKEVLELERELARVQTEIDQIEGRLKGMQSQVALSQIDVTLKRKRILGPLGYIGFGVAWAVEKLFIIE